MFRNRSEAGRLLAEMVASRLAHPAQPPEVAGAVVGPPHAGQPLAGVIARAAVLGLPRGGVPVAAEVADVLGVPLDVLVVRKIGAPWQPELALGAVGENGAVVLNDDVVSSGAVGPDELDALVRTASQEVEAIVARLRPVSAPLDVSGRTVVVVDDGVATGATARAAAGVLRRGGPGRVVLATPVAALRTYERLRSFFDDVICLSTPARFGSVGQHYQEFDQVRITEVRELLARSPA